MHKTRPLFFNEDAAEYCNAIFAGRLGCKLRWIIFWDKLILHGMTVFVLWHDILCHAMEFFYNQEARSKRAAGTSARQSRTSVGAFDTHILLRGE